MVDPRRVQVLNTATVGGGGPVLYVMGRDQRINDNWALAYAEEEARRLNVSLVVAFVAGPMFCNGSSRHVSWLVLSLQEVARTLSGKQIPFVLRVGEWSTAVTLLADELDASMIVFDQNPLEPIRSRRTSVAAKVSRPVRIVDAHNSIPVWEVSDKAEFAAYTIRPKIRRLYREFSDSMPPIPTQPVVDTTSIRSDSWEALIAFRSGLPDIPLPESLVPGEAAALVTLKRFIDERLPEYHLRRNNPTANITSELSAYIRWGNISVQRIATTVEHARGISNDAKAAFLEELIVRRELAENYVYYTPEYDSLSAVHPWAKATLEAHRADTRTYTYTYEQFASAQTHDPLWNAAQNEVIVSGRMHGYMRMYWAKKILEWTSSPEEAVAIALRLNDTYQLDGRDPNGVVGVLWAIGGLHDRPWSERTIFGKIRYMNAAGCRRKFDVEAYITRWNRERTSPFL